MGKGRRLYELLNELDDERTLELRDGSKVYPYNIVLPDGREYRTKETIRIERKEDRYSISWPGSPPITFEGKWKEEGEIPRSKTACINSAGEKITIEKTVNTAQR